GIAGAFIASWLFPKFGVHIGTGVGEQIVYAMMGSIILLLLLRLIRRA
ncbi:MAG: GlsB/YeaQ/YmgE family stress response membrane protein, partial [Proteobacteria bacterium]|nr:GlsB/YeaQ/YmgE family stress response membrane protein [Pseudomonadota bacterium]